MSHARRHDALSAALLILLPLLFFRGVVAGQSDFFIRDIAHYYYPAKKVLRNIVLAGNFPYWNPYFSAGQPLAANPEHEVFYPPNWLIFLPSYAAGFRLLIFFHLILGLLAMYALLRSMELRPSAAFAGAFAFGLGGLGLSYINLLPQFFSGAWMPLTILLARRFLLQRRPRDFALASLSLGVQFLIAEPTTTLQTGMLLAAYAIYRGGRSGRDIVRAVALVLAIGIAGFAVGAVQMLPGLDHARDSVRANGLAFEVIRIWSTPPVRVIELVYPNAFGHIFAGGRTAYWGQALYGRARWPYLFSIYSGLLLTALAAAGVIARMRGWLFFLLLCIASLVLTTAAHTPLLRILYAAGVDFIRYYEKFALIGIFAIVVFGSHAFARLLDGDERIRRAAIGVALLTVVPAAVLAMTGGRLWSLAPPEEMLALARRDWIVAAFRGAGLALLLWTMPRVRQPLWIALAIAFTIADLAPLGGEIAPTTQASFLTETPPAARRLAREKGQFRVFHEAQWYGIYQRFQRQSLTPPVAAEFGIETVMESDYDLTALRPTEELTGAMLEIGKTPSPRWPQPLAAMSNAWYRVVPRAVPETETDLATIEPVAFLPLERQPRYYFADVMVPIRGRDDFVKILRSYPVGNRTAFVANAFPPARGIVHGSETRANDIRLDVESFGRAFLVISVTPHKYWRVTIDGRRVTPAITNLGYQGLEIPRGRHVVEMRYRNPLIAVGGAISIAALILLAAITMRAR